MNDTPTVCASVPNFLILEWQIYFHRDKMYKEIVSHDGEMVVDGHIPLSEKPGIGVDINIEAMRRYAAEGVPFSRAEMNALLDLAQGGIAELVQLQKDVLGA